MADEQQSASIHFFFLSQCDRLKVDTNSLRLLSLRGEVYVAHPHLNLDGLQTTLTEEVLCLFSGSGLKRDTISISCFWEHLLLKLQETV